MSSQRTGAPGEAFPEALLEVFARLRQRPSAHRIREQRRFARRAAHRRSYRFDDGGAPEDLAAPPPVLNVRVTDQREAEELTELLRRRSWPHPFAVLHDCEERAAERRTGSAADAGTGARANASGRGGAAERQAGDEATTAEVYRLVGELAATIQRDRGTEGGPARAADGAAVPEPGKDGPRRWAAGVRAWASGRRPPHPPRLPRWDSLEALAEIDVQDVLQRLNPEHARKHGGERGELAPEPRTHLYVTEKLREHRARRRRSGRRSGADRPPPAFLRKAKDEAYRFIAFCSRKLNFSWLDHRILTPVGFLLSTVPLLGFPLLAIFAGWLDNALTLAILGLLAAAYGLGALFYLPWRRYLWLLRQPYQPAPDTPSSSMPRRVRDIGIATINAVSDARSRTEPLSREQPPIVHLLAVNALLDDLNASYGTSLVRHRLRYAWLPQRGRTRLPVLVVDEGRVGRVARHVVALIEDIRREHRFPDPLLVVRIGPRSAAREPQAEPPPEHTLEDWLHTRFEVGRLGPSREVRFEAPAPRKWDANGRGELELAEADTVLTTRALAVRWLAGMAAAAALLLTAASGVVALAHAVDPCVQGAAVLPPQGIVTEDGQCVGYTDGSFVFDERLRSVQRRIAEQNADAEDAGGPVVTVVYFGALSVPPGSGDSVTSGVYGELIGLAHGQDEYNRIYPDQGYAAIRILIANTGASWRQAVRTAGLVAGEMRRDPTLLAAVGFGSSLGETRAAIGELTRAGLPMVSTAATFDNLSELQPHRHSEFFFPIAPSNTRIARQAATWAYHGAAGGGRALEPARSAVALADDSPGELYGIDLATTFARQFTDQGGHMAPFEPVHHNSNGLNPEPGVLTYGGPEQPDILTRAAQICADPPDLIYYAGRSDEFGPFYDYLLFHGDCAGGVTILAADDISKYVTDNIAHLTDNIGRNPVFYTPLAATGAWGVTGGRGAPAFYRQLNRLEDELGLRSGREGPSRAHEVMAYDALLVVTDALRRAQNAQRIDTEERRPVPADLRLPISETSGLGGVSGLIDFGPPAEGHWYDERVVQLVLAGPVGPGNIAQQTIAVCGRVTTSDRPDREGCL
ncbi:type 1 periplasmic-binding domain-containing protein [Marinitenerispora sediminis]|uniref:Uncharacterized protein n=1 Tax=Marinitenerispora sediminis TaxID=1931232 RepID=A0A368T538_9ACTN|nr:hypothetical protein [Marinitenerispora sediminis]RCV50674.1 hypothetical protein DEF23_21725 [Marinitenerispora sediminis]RCV54160.1 hypothetical protein DEF24_19690 [Marinitenerispora sediminis]RCV54888.1 hypothetical protein DEF28_07295 [Marinitenerispora sediminis]